MHCSRLCAANGFFHKVCVSKMYIQYNKCNTTGGKSLFQKYRTDIKLL